jgi:predicted O-methyltransferase YrrM
VRNNQAGKVALAARTVVAAGFGPWRLAFQACHGAANQKWSELSRLICLVQPLRPKWVLEIGVCSGGTLALWSRLAHHSAHLIGIDRGINPEAERRIRAAMSATQTLHLIRRDSHCGYAAQELASILMGNPLDFLFIDGDHSYSGVRQDWQMYSPFVTAGSLIAFHDIVPDHALRFGIQTEHDAGGVHEFWREIKLSFPHHEFVEDPSQNGYGIGVITV